MGHKYDVWNKIGATIEPCGTEYSVPVVINHKPLLGNLTDVILFF